jgi:hypothetical protein
MEAKAAVERSASRLWTSMGKADKAFWFSSRPRSELSPAIGAFVGSVRVPAQTTPNERGQRSWQHSRE